MTRATSAPDAEGVVLSTWFGAFLVRDGRVVDSRPGPTTAAELTVRLALRRAGRTTPEEEELVRVHSGARLVTRDRRLASLGVEVRPVDVPPVDPGAAGVELATYSRILLDRARADLAGAWDPALPIPDAFRALADLESAENVLSERLEGWQGPPGDASPGPPLGPDELDAARAGLEALLHQVRAAHDTLQTAIDRASERKAPNLVSLLGPRLTAQLIAHAGGLDRLARLPASTIQVLGAERAFFRHLRGGAPPPRHGLLFLHPVLHAAPRKQRGRLARALAGKVAIAARLDRAGEPVRADLASTFRARVGRIETERPRGSRLPDRRAPSPFPLDRAAEDG